MRPLLVAALATLALVAGCGDPGSGSMNAEVVTTGPEPGAELASTPTTPGAGSTTPGSTTPGGATTPEGPKRNQGNAAKKQADKAGPSPTPTPTAKRAGPTPEWTIAPAATLKPKEPTDAVDLAYAREILLVLAAASALAQSVEEHGHDERFRSFAMKLYDRRSDDLGHIQFRADTLGNYLSQAADPKSRHVIPDLRLLGLPPDAMDGTRALIMSASEGMPFDDLEGTAFDAAIVDAMIEQHESILAMTSSKIQTGGGPWFSRFATRLERRARGELEQLRAFKRGW